ncbi:MAG: response regulator [Desulfobacteraceae bacterium]|nr:response regulator [Desulfobacteraceae bacterium]MBC2755035.1 response regulator [Desulfobacteraceae bacterium]
MSIITFFSGSYCNDAAVLDKFMQKSGYPVVDDRMIMAEASRASGLSEKKIQGAFSAKTSIFNQFTHEKERSIAHLRLALAGMLDADNLIISGASSLLIPKNISHVLRVCLIADMKSRIANAQKQEQISEKEATVRIHKDDENMAAWVNTILGINDPWASSSYDIMIPTDKTGADESVQLISQHSESDVIQVTDASKQAISDFQLATKAGEALANAGHNVTTDAKNGTIFITINKNVLMLARLEEELKQIVEKIPGVKGVETSVGENFYQPDIYRKYDFQMPSKILLVDDEREFVQTLSERLIMRDMGSAVAYDGESALNMVNEEEPEVMILDLKMPGIDGIEVLRKVKASRPDIEVIILTGHGSEADREICMGLGAFAYLHKPVDIDLLSTTLKQANEKVRNKK